MDAKNVLFLFELASYCPRLNKFEEISLGGSCDEVAEWLRRWTANPLGSARVGSNPILVEGPMV